MTFRQRYKSLNDVPIKKTFLIIAQNTQITLWEEIQSFWFFI